MKTPSTVANQADGKSEPTHEEMILALKDRVAAHRAPKLGSPGVASSASATEKPGPTQENSKAAATSKPLPASANKASNFRGVPTSGVSSRISVITGPVINLGGGGFGMGAAVGGGAGRSGILLTVGGHGSSNSGGGGQGQDVAEILAQEKNQRRMGEDAAEFARLDAKEAGLRKPPPPPEQNPLITHFGTRMRASEAALSDQAVARMRAPPAATVAKATALSEQLSHHSESKSAGQGLTK